MGDALGSRGGGPRPGVRLGGRRRWVRWGYTFAPVDGGTQVTKSWEFLPGGITRFHERYGDDAENQIAEHTEAARRGIPLTLAALKQAAEAAS